MRRRHASVIEDVTNVYCRAMAALVDTPREFDVYVTEKRSPSAHKGLVKDGLHLIAPDVVTRPALQLLLRKDVLPALADVFRPLGLANTVDDVVDEAVIERNNWMMYGSKKPGGEAYAVTRRYRFSCATGAVSLIAEDQADVPASHYVELFSIRNKYDELRVRDNQQDRAEAFIAKLDDDRRRREAVQAVISTTPNQRANVCEDMDLVRKLVDILDVCRVERYDDWVRLGWCLRNIDHRLLETWVEASKRSSKYMDGECSRLWDSMRSGGLGVGTLHMWARTDSPERYRELLRLDLVALIKGSVNATHYDVARVVHHLYRYEYVCCNIRNRTWYEFKGHRWCECDSAYSLRKRLSTDVFKEYMGVVQLVAHRARSPLLFGGSQPALQTAVSSPPSPGPEQQQQQQAYDMRDLSSEDGDGGGGGSAVVQQAREEMQKACAEQIKKLTDLALKLKVTKFKDDVLKECAELFYHERFEDKLNSDVNLLGFENGVFDLAANEFREGRPDDFVSFSTGINYVPYVDGHPIVRDVVRFWESVQPDRAIREYVLMTLASCLSGNIREERFHIWTGSGCHAAGTLLLKRDGLEVAVEDVRVGDELMGDDGKSGRRVERLIRGRAPMFSVVPISYNKKIMNRGDPFVVNGAHVLSLRVSGASSFEPDASCGCFYVRWIEAPPHPVHACEGEGALLYVQCVERYASYARSASAFARLVNEGVAPDSTAGIRRAMRDGDVLDVTVDHYLAHLAALDEPTHIDPYLRLYRPACVEYAADADDSAWGFYKNWGAAWARGAFIATEALRVAASRTKTACIEVFTHEISDPAAGLRHGRLPVRRAFIASLFEGCGYVAAGHSPIVALPSCLPISAIVSIARSIGIDCTVLPTAHSFFAYVNLGETPPGVVCCDAVSPQHRFQQQQHSHPPWLLDAFMVEPCVNDQDQDYYGFELPADTNRRYLMADFVATHNSNGKSLSVSLFEKSLGQYCCKFPVTLLTQKRAASNTATPEIARAKGRRFAVLQEPSEDERLNVGQLKELSGGDTVQTRELFKAPCEWRPQFKLFLLCNQLPHVPSDDGGTWRRIRVVEFGSKFVENPNPERPNEFPVDLELSNKIDGWKEHFMALLLQYYRRYISRSLEEPEAVIRCTRDYQRTNDHMADFVDTCVEKVPAPPRDGGPQQQPDAFLALDDAFNELKEWLKADQIPIRLPKKTALQKYLDRTLVRSAPFKGRTGYRGFRIRDRFAGLAGGEEDEEF
jgi:P4 family phage/plasmid primase-like protien